jgi:hypothetical protein
MIWALEMGDMLHLQLVALFTLGDMVRLDEATHTSTECSVRRQRHPISSPQTLPMEQGRTRLAVPLRILRR